MLQLKMYLVYSLLKYLLELLSDSNDKFISLYKIKERALKSYFECYKINKIGDLNINDIDNLVDLKIKQMLFFYNRDGVIMKNENEKRPKENGRTEKQKKEERL